MKETDLQDKYVMKFLCEEPNGLRYREVKANTVSPQFFVVEDLRRFLAETSLNEKSYKQLLPRFGGNEKALLAALTEFLNLRIGESANMALFFHNNTTVTFESVKLHLFYPSGGVTDAQDKLFEENIFSVVQELPYAYKHGGSTRFQFRPDLTFFLNGMFLGYCELKSNYNNQTAHRNGRRKVAKDYLQAAQSYLKLAEGNDVSQSIRRDFLKIFEKAIHVTSTDLTSTYVIRSLAQQLDELKAAPAGEIDSARFQESLEKDFPAYPLRHPEGTIRARFEEVFRALYDKRMIEKEILYYNFLERELIKKEGSPQKEYKHSDGRLISPRPKQKFGTDKVIDKIDELLAHEAEPDYFVNELRKQLKKLGVGDAPAQELIAERQKYHNNKYVYSLLLQYAAGFGKSNIIGWLALQLKDLRRNGSYVYDKILLVVDRLQLRDQLDTKMHNMNIQKSMFVEADTKATFLAALQNDSPRIVVVNLQKFGQVTETLPAEVLHKLGGLRVAFLIDEIHRSNSGEQNAAMLDVFEELQTALDKSVAAQPLPPTKKNLLVGFTATPSDRTLARFGEFAHYAENKALWVPFDSFTMREAIEAGFILNPLLGVVPVSAKMYFEVPENALAGFEGDIGYNVPDNTDTGVDAEGRKYAIRKRRIYQNPERIQAIARFVVERLVASVYPNIRGTAKAMLAVASIPAAIQYKKAISQAYAAITQPKKYERFKDAPVYIVYSDSQEHPAAGTLNEGLTEAQVMQNFAGRKNGLIIVVDKLQTGFDEPKLHTLFLDKEIRDINAIQTISRVNRKIKYKHDCKIIDFSYQNINVRNIKEAFEKFSNVVVSDFDPLGSEQQLAIHYDDLREHALFTAHFSAYAHYYQSGQTDITPILELEEAFATYINTQPAEAKKLKRKIGKYFRLLNLIAFVLDIDAKFSEEHFLRFWRRYNHEYNSIHGHTDPVDDVEIYFDHYIGIVAPAELPAKATGQLSIVSEDAAPFGKKYKYNILRVIEKRNQQEEAIEALIKDFEAKIDLLFDFIRTDNDGKRIVAKMQSTNAHFDADEIYGDFTKVYRKFTRRHKEEVGEFFIRETKGNINQLCDDFEKALLASAT